MRKGRKVYAEVPSKSNSYNRFQLDVRQQKHTCQQKQQTRIVQKSDKFLFS